jgi:hypothetical protein
LRGLRYLWAAPWSVVGLVLSLFFRSKRVIKGVLLAEGASWPRRLGWHYRAITLGHVILCVDEADEGLLDHELVHVRQYEKWGPFFIPAYLIGSAQAKLGGRRAYADNPFEIAARSIEPPPDGR